MAKKSTTSFVCQECGYDTPQWLGKCPECGQWNSLKEFTIARVQNADANNISSISIQNKPKRISEIAYEKKSRIQTKYEEMNTVLGGGVVKGSVTLIAGDPGVGKSTLLLQLALGLAKTGKKVLYVSGEESVEQVKMRAVRINEKEVQNKKVIAQIEKNESVEEECICSR